VTAPSPWVRGRVLYHLHALAAAAVPAVNANVRAAEPCDRGFRRLARWIDHVARLGCGGVLLTPVCVSSTHDYDTVDPYRIDQRLGDEEDFAAFVDACHARDLRTLELTLDVDLAPIQPRAG
jgi:cyclomaltodextrinase